MFGKRELGKGVAVQGELVLAPGAARAQIVVGTDETFEARVGRAVQHNLLAAAVAAVPRLQRALALHLAKQKLPPKAVALAQSVKEESVQHTGIQLESDSKIAGIKTAELGVVMRSTGKRKQ
jgi:hypothetical protein